jgi:hypothetical protein
MQIIHTLPDDYQPAYHLKLLEPGNLLKINLLSLIPLALALLLMDGWWRLVLAVRGSWPGGWGADLSGIIWVIGLIVIIIPLHEWLHGLGIRRAGHRPRYGFILEKGAFYATADQAYFWRNDYLIIALLPVVVITLLGMALVALLPDVAGYYVGLGVVINAASSIGDLWMTVVVWRYPPSALVQDEMDSLRVFVSTSRPT